MMFLLVVSSNRLGGVSPSRPILSFSTCAGISRLRSLSTVHRLGVHVRMHRVAEQGLQMCILLCESGGSVTRGGGGGVLGYGGCGDASGDGGGNPWPTDVLRLLSPLRPGTLRYGCWSGGCSSRICALGTSWRNMSSSRKASRQEPPMTYRSLVAALSGHQNHFPSRRRSDFDYAWHAKRRPPFDLRRKTAEAVQAEAQRW